MAEKIHLKLMTASGTVLDEQVSYLSLPTPEGSLGVLADHAPMLCALGEGRLKYRGADGTERFAFVSGGVAGVERNEVTVLAKEAKAEE